MRRERHARLVDRLVGDVRPVRPLWPVRARFGAWAVVALAAMAAVVGFGGRADLAARLREPVFVVPVLLLIAAGGVAAALALRAAVPGRTPPVRFRHVATVLAAAALVPVLWLDPAAPAGSAPGIACALWVAGAAVPPCAALLVALRRGAPLVPPVAGSLAGLGGLLIAAAAVRLACGVDRQAHVLFWHLVPVFVVVPLVAALASAWLRGWRRSAPPA